MTIDYIEKITLQEELKNVKEQLKTVQDENAKLKTDIDLCYKADTEKTKKIASLSAAVYRLSEEKRQEGDNLRNRIKDLEAEIDQLKSNTGTVSYSELMAIHTADVETINELNIKVRDLNITISTLLERVSMYDKENQDLKKRVQQLKYIIEDLNKKLYE